ncbi:hypothetical protein A1O3_07891 [Capronia epimyces CBS 606.96]|uniref:Transcription factor TFIIIB component B'' Myb domain-containing protein n=1 Tax=Capronia epimyces CBS 606.96 TaxID=1182542 RepID=W9XGH1_9EURO|nr:uncharacterized protein A1O3_07891 [Capronia epimyces CBS 606.96]EXJ79612.1 hypothetical protein A1O3_07891 [Capronia epimyces CBS 606.96]
MSSFSSVVRKPGQKITPKTAPRRNVQRHPVRPAAPPSSTTESHNVTESPTAAEDQTVTESQTITPSVDHVEGSSEGQGVVQEHSILESTETPPRSEPFEISLPAPAPLETAARASPDVPTDTTAPDIVSITVAPEPIEVIAPSSANYDVTVTHMNTSPDRAGTIPTIATSSTSPAPKGRLTNESTPAQPEATTQWVEGAAGASEPRPERSSKRQKTTHPSQDTGEVQPRATPTPTDDTHLIFRSSPRHRRSESRTSDVLLQDATSQAAAVSELANSIENRIRSLKPRSARPAASSTVETESPDQEVSEADVSEAPRPNKSRKKKQRAKAIQDLARQVIENAVGTAAGSGGGSNRSLSRLSTPENAEDYQIDPDEISMGALVSDSKLGKKSETEKKMQQNWEDIKQRRKEEIERRREAAAQRKHGRQALTLNQDLSVEETQAHVPQQIIVNGQIVVAAESREVVFGAGVHQAVIEDADVALEDDRIYKYVHQGTLGKHAGQRRGTRWDIQQTELFYRGLRMFGTDFSMIANLFPSLDRKQIKLKFLAEERAHPARVKRSVAAKEPVSIDEYSRMTNQHLEDPVALQAELDAEEKRLREDDERRRTNEGYVLDGADIALPSTERDVDLPEDIVGDSTGANTGSLAHPGVTGRPEHITALARGSVTTAAAPARKSTQPRRKEPVGRGRQAKKGRIPMEGVEERLGPIDEIYE